MVTQFASPLTENSGFHQIMAVATNLDGFTVVSDFGPHIQNYLRKTTVFWPLLKKSKAEADIVREIKESDLPTTGFFGKRTLNPTETPTDMPLYDLTDAGQEVKAIGGLIQIPHYARSLYRQQSSPYGDIIAQKTQNLIASTARTIERALFLGNATSAPLEFNGIAQQMPAAGHHFTADITAGDSVIRKLRSVVRLAISDQRILRSITHIFTSALGLELIENEAQNILEYMNLDKVNPGLRVPGIITQGDSQGKPTPIITSPYLMDANVVTYWLLDMDLLSWKGVIPEGGDNTFEPQMFEVSRYTTDATPYLVEKRMCLLYGTLYAQNRGEGIYRLDVTVPSNLLTGI